MTPSPPPLTEPHDAPHVERPLQDESLFSAAPPRDPLVGAILRHKLLVLVVALLVTVAGVAIGSTRKPTYTSAATLQVGTVNPNSPGFYGFVQSASDLATAFSRSITAAPVLADVHAKLGLSAGEAVGRLSAEPIPISPSFRIIATGPTAKSAIGLANVASDAVITYESQTNSTSPRAAELLATYGRAAQALQQASSVVNRLSASPATSHSSALIKARAARDAAQLHANALGAAYQSALVSSGPSSGLVSLLAGAVTASSDHKSKIELLGFIGLLAGLVLGSIVALLYEQRSRPRRSH